MLKIAIVDDENAICSELEEMVINSCKKLKIEFDVCDIFYNGKALCTGLRDGSQYDLIFLDIELPELNGVDAGFYIREQLFDNRTQIIFISSKQDYAMELFDIRPMNFFVKPLTSEKILSCLEKYNSIFMRSETFSFSVGKVMHSAKFSEVMYFESSNKTIVVHRESDTLTFYGKLSELISLAPVNFFQIHKFFSLTELSSININMTK